MSSNRSWILRRSVIGLAFLILLVRGSEKSMQAAEKDLETRNKQAVQDGFDAWRNGTGNVFDLLAADAAWTIVGNSPVSRTFNSKQEFLDVVITPFNQRMSKPLRPTVHNLY